MAHLSSKREYEYQCKKCNVVTSEFRKMEERDNVVKCNCGEEMQRKLSFGSFKIN